MITKAKKRSLPAVQVLANRVCNHLPEGVEIRLCMKRGDRWVELLEAGESIDLPGPSAKSIDEQINDALCVATGWIEAT